MHFTRTAWTVACLALVAIGAGAWYIADASTDVGPRAAPGAAEPAASAPSALAAERAFDLADEPSVQRAPLTRSIRGRVQWPDLQPSPCELTLTRLRDDGSRAVLPALNVDSEADGRFRIEAPFEGSYVLVARAHLPAVAAHLVDVPVQGYWMATSAVNVPFDGELLLTLDPLESLRGHVVSSGGGALASFEVFVMPRPEPGARADGRQRFSQEFETTTGAFELVGLAPGAWDVWVSAARHWDSAFARVVVPSETELAVQIERAQVLRGFVVDAAGHPLNRCAVRATWPASAQRAAGAADALTFHDGSFDLDMLAPTIVEVTVRRDDIERRALSLDLTGGAPARPVRIEVTRRP